MNASSRRNSAIKKTSPERHFITSDQFFLRSALHVFLKSENSRSANQNRFDASSLRKMNNEPFHCYYL